MIKVALTSGTASQYTDGKTEVNVEAKNVRQMVAALERDFPGLGTEIQQSMSVAIDGVILPDPYLEAVDEDSEIFILPKIGGG
ncbi:MAG: MoaD/ThiS family protein [Proteobacteria bacterium]|nr:MoaD/ThiS family protein [Pseudomonadota bacterium]